MFPPERVGGSLAESETAIQMSESPRPAFAFRGGARRSTMVWRGREPDPMTDPAASAVLEAFDAAWTARLPPVVCYRAGS